MIVGFNGDKELKLLVEEKKMKYKNVIFECFYR